MDLKTIAIILVLFCLIKKFMKDNFGMYNPLYSKTHRYSAPLRNPKLCANANGAHNCSSDFLPLQGAGAGFWMSKTDDQNNLLISEVNSFISVISISVFSSSDPYIKYEYP